MIPTPPMPSEAEQEEARRQAAGQGGTSGLDVIGDGASAVVDGAVDVAINAIVDAAGEALGATVKVAEASLELVGGILGSLGDV